MYYVKDFYPNKVRIKCSLTSVLGENPSKCILRTTLLEDPKGELIIVFQKISSRYCKWICVTVHLRHIVTSFSSKAMCQENMYQ